MGGKNLEQTGYLAAAGYQLTSVEPALPPPRTPASEAAEEEKEPESEARKKGFLQRIVGWLEKVLGVFK